MDAPIYSDMWKAWQDPHVPEYFNPTEVIIDKHADGALADKPALLADEGTITFARLKQEMCRSANGLRQLGLPVESRILVFATDSLATIATWFGAVRSGIVPGRNLRALQGAPARVLPARYRRDGAVHRCGAVFKAGGSAR